MNEIGVFPAEVPEGGSLGNGKVVEVVVCLSSVNYHRLENKADSFTDLEVLPSVLLQSAAELSHLGGLGVWVLPELAWRCLRGH